jgi:hypothetical protein
MALSALVYAMYGLRAARACCPLPASTAYAKTGLLGDGRRLNVSATSEDYPLHDMPGIINSSRDFPFHLNTFNICLLGNGSL